MEFDIRLLLLTLWPFMFVMSQMQGPASPISLATLRHLDELSSSKIETSEQAGAYVEKVAEASGLKSPPLLTERIKARFANAELAAAANPDRLVSDESLANAFNFLSEEFGVSEPSYLTTQDLQDYRTVLSGIFPNLMGSPAQKGVRPVAAGILLDLLLFNGGVISEGTKAMARSGQIPGKLKLDALSARIAPARATRVELKYQAACQTYFRRHSPTEIESLYDRLMTLLKF